MGAGKSRFLLLLGFMVYAACLGFPARAGADAESTMVLIMGEPLHLQAGDPAPYVMDGIIMVPARPTLEAFDAAVLWNGAEQSITAVTDQHRVTLFIGRTDALVDGRTQKVEMAPVIMQGRAMLPLRFLVESFGATFEWSKAVWVYLPDDPVRASAVPASVLAGGPAPRNLTGAVRHAGIVLVPMAELVRAMGGQSVWDPAKQAETARVGSATVTVFRGQSLAVRTSSAVNGNHGVNLGFAPRLGDGTLMVPIDTLVPALGGRVKLWDGQLVIAPPLLLQVNGQRLLPPFINRSGVVMAETQAVLAAMGAEDLALPEATMPLQELVDAVGGSLAWVGNEAVVASPITVAVQFEREESAVPLPARLGENASVMVPADTLADALGLNYAESTANRSVTLRSGSRWVTVYADKQTADRSAGPAWSKTEEFRASATPVWRGAKLTAPLGDLVESLGLRYTWDSRTATATITYAPTPPFANWPARSTVLQSDDQFGTRLHPVYRSISFHDGMDLSESEGTPIDVVAPGKVIMAQRDGDYGLTVRVDHGGGVVTQYSHLSSIAVCTGQWVGAGEYLGDAGNTGLSTGPHLHFMVIVNGQAVDPDAWLP